MVKLIHPAFRAINKRVLIVDRTHRNKLGILVESEEFNTTAEGRPRSALDFIEPIYNPNPKMEDLAMGRIPKGRINPKNPILSLHLGIDYLRLNYRENRDGVHVFEGELHCVVGAFFDDGNSKVFNQYVAQLNKAGFEIYEV